MLGLKRVKRKKDHSATQNFIIYNCVEKKIEYIFFINLIFYVCGASKTR